MRIISALAIVLLAGLAGAQTLIPLPAYSNSFSISSATRGFYFQTPVDFIITGLRVPDEKNHGKQNVAVYRPAAKPPAYSGSASGGLLFFKAGEPSSTIIPCQIPFRTGDWVGILGACGDASIMHNSYGSPRFPSQVLGHSVTLLRFLTQTNIVVTRGNAPYSNEDNGSISRIEVYVRPAATLVGSGTGAPGTFIDFTLTARPDANLPFQMGSSFGKGPIHIDTRTIDLSADDLLVLSVTGLVPMIFNRYSGYLDTNGTATARLNIPNYPILKGVGIHTAFVTLLGTAPSGVSSISKSFHFIIL